jgi:hypothetical protein
VFNKEERGYRPSLVAFFLIRNHAIKRNNTNLQQHLKTPILQICNLVDVAIFSSILPRHGSYGRDIYLICIAINIAFAALESFGFYAAYRNRLPLVRIYAISRWVTLPVIIVWNLIYQVGNSDVPLTMVYIFYISSTFDTSGLGLGAYLLAFALQTYFVYVTLSRDTCVPLFTIER